MHQIIDSCPSWQAGRFLSTYSLDLTLWTGCLCDAAVSASHAHGYICLHLYFQPITKYLQHRCAAQSTAVCKMASKDTNSVTNSCGILSIHEMFHIVGDQMTGQDVKVLKILYSAVLSRNYLEKIKDGFTFLVALEKIGRLDESNFKHILHLLRIINRHDLTPYLTLRRRQTGLTTIHVSIVSKLA